MTKLITILVVLLLAVGGGCYYYLAYPPTLLKHSVTHSLDKMSAAFATKDSKQIDAMLTALITEEGQIDLEVKMYSISQMNGGTPQKQTFDRSAFISFVDNIIYSLQDYAFSAELDKFDLSKDRKTANITFTTKAWGDGMSYYGGMGVNMRFNTESTCEAVVIFDGMQALLDKASCKVQLSTLPKPGEESKLSNPDALRSILR